MSRIQTQIKGIIIIILSFTIRSTNGTKAGLKHIMQTQNSWNYTKTLFHDTTPNINFYKNSYGWDYTGQCQCHILSAHKYMEPIDIKSDAHSLVMFIFVFGFALIILFCTNKRRLTSYELMRYEYDPIFRYKYWSQ